MNQWNYFASSSNRILCWGLFPQNNPLPLPLPPSPNAAWLATPVAVQAWFDDTGLDVWGRMSFRIWGPDTPKPLVAKN
jgi:hypothetical protein